MYLFYLRIDRDKAQKEADVLRQQLAPNGPVRSRIESLIDAVRKLTEERDRLLAFAAPKHQPVSTGSSADCAETDLVAASFVICYKSHLSSHFCRTCKTQGKLTN